MSIYGHAIDRLSILANLEPVTGMRETLSSDISNFMELKDMSINGHVIDRLSILAILELIPGGPLGTFPEYEINPIIRNIKLHKIERYVNPRSCRCSLTHSTIMEPVTGGPLGTLPEYERNPIIRHIKLHEIERYVNLRSCH